MFVAERKALNVKTSCNYQVLRYFILFIYSLCKCHLLIQKLITAVFFVKLKTKKLLTCYRFGIQQIVAYIPSFQGLRHMDLWGFFTAYFSRQWNPFRKKT